jgi:hypothetical protein
MKAPASFIIPMTPAEYSSLSAKMTTSQATVDGNTGTLKTSDVTLVWAFDGVNKTTVTVTDVHSFKAHCATEQEVQDHITAELQQA